MLSVSRSESFLRSSECVSAQISASPHWSSPVLCSGTAGKVRTKTNSHKKEVELDGAQVEGLGGWVRVRRGHLSTLFVASIPTTAPCRESCSKARNAFKSVSLVGELGR